MYRVYRVLPKLPDLTFDSLIDMVNWLGSNALKYSRSNDAGMREYRNEFDVVFVQLPQSRGL